MYHFDQESADLLFETAQEMGLQPTKLTDFGLVEIIVDGKIAHILQSYSILNTQLSTQLSRHKHLTRVVLQRHHLPNIPYLRTTEREAVEVFLREHKQIIAKPVIGSRSAGVVLISEKTQLTGLPLEELIFEKYIEGREMRFVVLQHAVVSVLEKVHAEAINDPQKAERISYPQEQWDQKLVGLAQQIAKVLGLGFAAVDFIVDEQEEVFLLEVNSAAALRRIQHPTSGPGIDIARMFLEATVAALREKS